MNNTLKLFVIFSAFAFCIYACKNNRTKIDPAQTDSTRVASQNINDTIDVKVKTIASEKGWGYDIYIDEKLYIHQPTIPAISGIQTFKTEKNAKTAGEFVAYKIRNNIMPPSVTVQELDSLGVLAK